MSEEKKEWKKPERYVPAPGAPSLPPQLSELNTGTTDELMEKLNKLPFFMTQLDESNGEENIQLEALKALAYEGEPDEIALNFKNQGNDCFKVKKYVEAIKYYDQALAVKCCVSEIDTACLINKAACNLELRNYRKCINDCKAALKLSPVNIKAIYRSGKAYYVLDHINECIDILRYGLTIEPENKQIVELLGMAENRNRVKDDLERKKRQKQELMDTKSKCLDMALRANKIFSIQTGNAPDLPHGVSLHLENETDPSSTIYFPAVFLYPVDYQSDFIQEFALEHSVQDHLEAVFEETPEWFGNIDNPTDYNIKNLEAYLQTESGGLIKAGKKLPISSVLSNEKLKVPVVDNVIRVYILPKNKSAEWIKSWNKEQAREMLR
ncbi:TPR-like protein [Nadsonia fulvescens var. elongata DSM 6958]|uniref:TPR-like protein n=1 Tax=Nadsonia fulvescens var. elongata DSM 6958 TaxID=857566 RepID=A0A1E3PF06_9ASCO|nr:TPR-like protein [Nadsonia fulvescens var. elongata DSM 6958]